MTVRDLPTWPVHARHLIDIEVDSLLTNIGGSVSVGSAGLETRAKLVKLRMFKHT